MRRAAVLLVAISFSAGCAGLWGFKDYVLDEDGGDAGDATMPEGSAEASLDGSRDATTDGPLDTTTADDHALDRGGDAAVDVDAAQTETGADVDAGVDCGPTNTILDCAGCNNVCDNTRSLGATCNGITCTYDGGCAPGWVDCDGAPPNTDGCESSLSSLTSCGGCGRSCNSTHSNGAQCNGTSCTYTGCATGWGDCDGSAPNTDGCETSLMTASNCGRCGKACDTLHSLDAGCSGSGCTYAGCAPGWVDCDPTPPDTDGCETEVDGGASCGACGQSCDSTSGHSLGASCNGTTCNYTGCAGGWADCNKAPPDTHGCDTSLSTVSNCGACGVACDTSPHSLDAGCNGTTCTYASCAAGWADCNVTVPPDSDGCETSLSSPSSCGMCGRACNTMTGTATCDGTTCSYTCNAGRANCNTGPPNTGGCECATPSCCGTICQTIHVNGVGQNYYDCDALKTYDETHAQRACAAFSGSGSQCTKSTSGLCLSLSLSAQSVCSTGAAACDCWQFAGPNQGTVQRVTGACTAACGTSGDPAWN